VVEQKATELPQRLRGYRVGGSTFGPARHVAKPLEPHPIASGHSQREEDRSCTDFRILTMVDEEIGKMQKEKKKNLLLNLYI
jgi:hypothetical protein